jgi:Eco29kI restriction endonuclease
MLFVPMAENLMIQAYRPVWNLIIGGFGNNDPGGRRYDQDRFRQDIRHLGRYWASRLADPPHTFDELRYHLAAHLDAY